MALRIALFGQAAFAKDVMVRLLDAGHELVGVYVPPPGKRPDPLAEEAEARGLRLLRHRRFRKQGVAIPELVKEHAELGADLNLLAYLTVILPVEIVDAPRERSLCFHPSLLPRYRGGNAIPWQIILGAEEAGVTVFQPDEGVDTGPILVQRGGVPIEPTDTAGSLYYRKLYPLGVEAIVEAVERIDRGDAQFQAQDDSQASFQGLVDDEVARIDWSRPCEDLDRLMRGCDPQPGAHARRGEEIVRFFDVRRLEGPAGAEPGTLVALGDDGGVVAVHGGRLAFRRVRVGEGPKLNAAESGLRVGDTLS